ncbi:MAG: phenylalanine--tRNA ligase subunit beta, partial [Bacteroidaceae bacterium]|nr:phenylalanine--tRNA ligase subunit beta [Bacteroidaceae bacterium]
MCIAGVFGGLESGTTEETKNVFLESAYFHPTWVRKTSRRHALQTDSSFRFERGTDPNNVIYALKQAAMLIKELAGGTISMEIKDIYPAPVEDFKVELEYEYVNNLIGVELSHDTIKGIVTSLEMKIADESEKGLTLLVPPYRVDVQRPCDVVEDILRIYGYNNINFDTTLHSSIITKGAEDRSHKLQNLISEQLVGCGFNEILNNSLTAAGYYDELESYKSENLVRLMNPLSNDLNVMRQTMLFGGLESMQRNISRKITDLSFFEFGNCYRFDADKRVEEKILSPYSESYHLALWMTGNNISSSWIEAGRRLSVYDLKAVVEHIFDRLGFKPAMRLVSTFDNDIFTAAIEFKAQSNKKTVAQLGILRKKVAKRFDIESEVFYADINWSELMKAIKNAKIGYAEISKYPAVKRDLALLLDKSVTFAQIEQVARETEKKLLKAVTLFDVYEGKNLEEGKKSYAVSFVLQDDNQTLNDKVIDKTMARLMENFEKRLGAIQR